jgi:hypothetical protein
MFPLIPGLGPSSETNMVTVDEAVISGPCLYHHSAGYHCRPLGLGPGHEDHCTDSSNMGTCSLKTVHPPYLPLGLGPGSVMTATTSG